MKEFGDHITSYKHAGVYGGLFIVIASWVAFAAPAAFCKKRRGIFVSLLVAVLLFFTSTSFNFVVPTWLAQNAINAEKFCEVTKKSKFYKSLNSNQQTIVINE
ncbi:hypothetical protein ACFO4O_13950, partial [Glaciecola siphonariae]